MKTFSNVTINNLSEISFIAGSYKEIYFGLTLSSGSPLDISNISFVWLLCPYNEPDYIVLQKNATISGSCFAVSLLSTETENLSGKYIQMPMIDGYKSYDYRLGQGIVNIIPAGGVN